MAFDTTLKGTMNKNRLFLISLIVTFTVSFLLFSIPGIAIYEWDLADIWARQSYGENVSDKVAVVGIDDDLFVVQDLKWPLEKDVYGELIFFLQEMGAKVIAFDLEFSHNVEQHVLSDSVISKISELFPEISDSIKDYGASDALFLEIVGMSPEVIMGYGFLVQERNGTGTAHDGSEQLLRQQIHGNVTLDQIDERFSVGKGRIELGNNYVVNGALLPYGKLAANMQACGFFNRSLQMTDGIDRWMPLMMEQDSLLFSSLALSAIQSYYGKNAHFDAEKKVVSIDTLQWSVTAKSDMAVNFKDSVPMYSMSDLLLSTQNYFRGVDPEIGKDQLEGRIVFIGYAAQSDGDLGKNPVSPKTDLGGQTPMVMLHAYAANTLMNDSEIQYIGRTGGVLLAIVILLFITILFMKLPPKSLYIILPIIIISTYFLGYFLYKINIFLPIVEVMSSSFLFSVAGILINYYDNNREFRYINQLFRTYVSPDIIDEMARTHTVPKLGGEEINGTAFFTDIEKFSTFSEMFTPEELIHILNEYFSQMTSILIENSGTLDKFIGDAIVAIFGAPYYSESNAVHACSAAWGMQQALDILRNKWSEDPLLANKVGNMRMRIGLNSGPFIVGNLGSDDQMSYTMIGDTVNLAARLESGAKQYGVYTLVGESTYEKAKDIFLFRCIDRIVVMGRSEPISVYELLAPLAEVNTELRNCKEKYELALDLYFEGSFSKALPLFKEAMAYEMQEGLKVPSRVMMERCEELITLAPTDWDGAYTMRSK